jgi:hypothetical protein
MSNKKAAGASGTSETVLWGAVLTRAFYPVAAGRVQSGALGGDGVETPALRKLIGGRQQLLA